MAKFENVDPGDWRLGCRRLLAGAARVVAPSADLAERIGRAFPEVVIEVFEPEPDCCLPPISEPVIVAGEPLRIAIIGAIGLAKGAEVLDRLARLVRTRRAPIRLSLIGDTPFRRSLVRNGVTVTGRYHDSDIDEVLGRVRPHVVFFPAIWPETWSFTLSLALLRGLPVIAFDIGAVAQRLRRLGRGTLLPLDLCHDSAGLMAALTTWRSRHCHADEGLTC